MSHHPYFIKSVTPAFPKSECEDPLHDDERGPRLLNTEKPDHYWNPKRKARIKRICPVCYAVRQFKHEQQMEQRKADLAAMDAHTANGGFTCGSGAATEPSSATDGSADLRGMK